MTFASYSTGTVSVSANGTVVTGAGTIWSGVNARPGDLLQIGTQIALIADVTDTTHLVVPPFGGATVSGSAYTIYQTSPLRFAGGQAMADVSALVAALNTDGWYKFVPSTATDPTSYGLTANDGQYAFQASTGKLWIMSGGAWAFLGLYKAFGVAAPWSAATAYGVNDIATLGGTSYICILAHTNHTPPNATYWAVLAAVGATGATPLNPVAPWVTATAYVVGPPASYVSQSGSSYQCLVAHTSGVFATDLAAGKWGLVAQAGTGYGGTSATSFLIGTGSKAFTTQAGLAYVVGSRVRFASAAGPSNYMEGIVTAYSGTTLTANITRVGGSGTFADWNLSVAGDPGSGDLLSTNNLSDVASAAAARSNLGIPAIHRSYLAGLTLSTAGASATFGIATGVAADSTNVSIMALASAYTKTTGAWAVGTGNGALDTGAIAASASYHVFLIQRPDTGVVDVLISLSATAPTLPANYTLFRRIGSMSTASSLWIKFSQLGDEFLLDATVLNVSNFTGSTTAQTATLSVPIGVKVTAIISVGGVTGASSDGRVYVSSFDTSDEAPATSNVNAGVVGASGTQAYNQLRIRTNTSAQTRYRLFNATGSVFVGTAGWVDDRGKNN